VGYSSVCIYIYLYIYIFIYIYIYIYIYIGCGSRSDVIYPNAKRERELGILLED